VNTSRTVTRGFRHWRWLAAGLVATLATTACGSSSTSSDGSSVKKITYWLSTSAQLAGYTDLAKAFEAKTGISVELVNVPTDGYQDKLRQAAQANSLPDAASVPGVDAIWVNKLQDLSATANNAANKIRKDITVQNGSKVLAIPSDITAAGLFLNKSLFDKANVSYPTDPKQTWTWDDFLAAADKVRTATNAKYDLVYDRSPARLSAFLYTHGGKGFQVGSDGKYAAPDEATVQALTKFKSMNDDKVMPKAVWTSGADPNALFKSGQVVAYFSGVWQVADFADGITNFQWVSAPTPAQPTHATDINLGGEVVAFDNGKSASAAKQWVDFLFQRDNYAKLAEANGYLAVETGLTLNYPFKAQAALDAFALYNKEIELADPISPSRQASGTALLLKGKAIQEDPTKDEMAKFLNGQQDVKKTIDNIVNGLNSQLN
jgi:alpha-1,4-digalacturonate transport system substrate-binding protein